MLKASLLSVALLCSVPALSDPQTTEAPAATTDPASAAQADAVVALAEARDLVEAGSNTTAVLHKAVGIYETHLHNPAVGVKVRADGWTDLSRAYLRLGDLDNKDSVKIAFYEKGKKAGETASALDPRHADAIFFATANQASIGRTRGVMNSLFMVGDLKKSLTKCLALDPGHHYARNTLGEIDHAVPGIAGGSDERAEKVYLQVLAADPDFTPSMVLLAQLKKDQGKTDEARAWANKVLHAKRSSVPNDWRKFDVPSAKKVLAQLDD